MEGEGEQSIISVFSIPAFYLCLVNLILLTDLLVLIELRTSFSVVLLYPLPFCIM